MIEYVVATLNVNFADKTDTISGVLKLEIDDRENGLNSGKTSFEPGDTVGIMMYQDGNVDLLVNPTSTSGGLTREGGGSKEIDEFITFSNSESGSLGYPPSGTPDLQWQGQTFKIDDNKAVPFSAEIERSYSQLKIKDNFKIAGVLRARYTTSGIGYKLRSVPKDITEVLVFAIGKVES
jgi:hypothetical protein